MGARVFGICQKILAVFYRVTLSFNALRYLVTPGNLLAIFSMKENNVSFSLILYFLLLLGT